MDDGPGQAASLPLALVLAAAGAGGGGICTWLTMAAEAAAHPKVQRAAVAAAHAAGEVVASGAHIVVNCNMLCVGYWPAIVIVNIVLITAFLAGWCILGGFMVAGGSGWWLARSHAQPAASGRMDCRHLATLANFISSGGESAIQQAALELHVSPEAVRTWWVHWQLAHCGPQRLQ